MLDKLKQFFSDSSGKIKSFICIGLMITALGCILIDFKYRGNQKGHFTVYEEQLTLKYQGAKCALVDETQRYIDSVAPSSCLRAIVVVDNCLKYDIDVCFVLAQGQKESHFGTQGLARKTNSVWNVFAFDGKTIDQIHKDGKYGSPDESVEPYMKLLSSRYLVNKTEYDLLDEYVDVHGKRYASDENYETALTAIFGRIKQQTKIDAYSQQLKKYDILLNH